MSEIRKHYFLSEYCIIAEERTKRPSDFADETETLVENTTESCSFCGGAEEDTPLATAVTKIEKFLQILLKREYGIGIFAVFRIFTLFFLLFLIL